MTPESNGAGSGRRVVELRMAALPENLALARLALAGVVAEAEIAVSGEVVADLKLAVVEACTHVIGLARSGGGHIVVRYELAGDSLSVDVERQEPESGAAGSLDGAAGSQEEAMGLMLLGALTDWLEVEPAESGRRVRFERRLS